MVRSSPPAQHDNKKEMQMKNSIISRIFSGGENRREREMHYLNHAVSIHDLERRQKDIENGLFR
jgi:hypothetical protein